jgi:predicted transcriptional regulator
MILEISEKRILIARLFLNEKSTILLFMSDINQIEQEIAEIRRLLRSLEAQKKVIGTFRDNRSLRDDIESNIDELSRNVRSLQEKFAVTINSEDYAFSRIRAEFDELGQQMVQQLPGLIDILKSGYGGESNDDGIGQDLLLDQQNSLAILQVNEILNQFQESRQNQFQESQQSQQDLFNEVMEGLLDQRHQLTYLQISR